MGVGCVGGVWVWGWGVGMGCGVWGVCSLVWVCREWVVGRSRLLVCFARDCVHCACYAWLCIWGMTVHWGMAVHLGCGCAGGGSGSSGQPHYFEVMMGLKSPAAPGMCPLPTPCQHTSMPPRPHNRILPWLNVPHTHTCTHTLTFPHTHTHAHLSRRTLVDACAGHFLSDCVCLRAWLPCVNSRGTCWYLPCRPPPPCRSKCGT